MKNLTEKECIIILDLLKKGGIEMLLEVQKYGANSEMEEILESYDSILQKIKKQLESF